LAFPSDDAVITHVPGENIETAPPFVTVQIFEEVADEYVTVPPSAVAVRLKLPEDTAREAIDPNVIAFEAALTEMVIVFVIPVRYVEVSVG
jgi:hypothetical protein